MNCIPHSLEGKLVVFVLANYAFSLAIAMTMSVITGAFGVVLLCTRALFCALFGASYDEPRRAAGLPAAAHLARLRLLWCLLLFRVRACVRARAQDSRWRRNWQNSSEAAAAPREDDADARADLWEEPCDTTAVPLARASRAWRFSFAGFSYL